MSEEERKPNSGAPDIPTPFKDLPLHRQKRIKRFVVFGSLLFLLLVFAFVFGLNAYTSYKKNQAVAEWVPPGIPVKVMEIALMDFEEVVEATAVIQPYQEVTVYPEVRGKVLRIDADLGDTVEENAPLVVLDDELVRLKIRQIDAQITKLTAMNEDAGKNLKRIEKLYSRSTVSESDLDQALLATQTSKGMLEEAEAALDMARYELRHTVVRSPISGVITERFLEKGCLASPQTPVARVVNIQRVKVEVGLIDEEIKRVHVGQEATLTVDAFPDEEFLGRVTAVGSQANARTLTFPVRVEKENTDPETRLLPGMIARISIKVMQHMGVVVVPREIIHEEGGRLTAFIVQDSQARKRFLTLGPYEKDRVIVSSGLEPGDKVVFVGHEILNDGSTVQIDTED